MKKLRTLLTLLVVSICVVQSAWADRSTPVLPTAVAPVSGQSYYLYNVMEQKFLCRSTTSTSYAAIGTYGDKITITATANENEYTIQWASNNYYLFAQDTYVNSSSSPNAKTRLFTISESAKGYTVQRSPNNASYYKADEYLGYDGTNGDRVNPALAEGSIHWTFLPVDEAEYYMAKHKLYTYLNIADTYNFYVTQYDNVYNNPASTTEQLNEAYAALYEAVKMSSSYVSPSWTEYPILFQNITDNKWTHQSSNNYLYWTCYSDGTVKTSELKATVNVDDAATLVYSYWNSDNYDSNYSSLRIFLDGELVQSVSSNQSGYSNSVSRSRRYYVELTPGKHDIVWEAVCNDSRKNYSHTNYLSAIGVVNTPTLYPATTTVEGQLGTEMLKLIDPISSTKKVVIKGVIGTDDWTTIGLMKNAFSIDMSGATAEEIPASQFTKEKYPFLHDVKLPQGIKTIGNLAFYQSDIENEITFPNTLETIGADAFYRSKVKGAHMSDNSVKSVGNDAFGNCYYLENVTWSSVATVIPTYCFNDCCNLRTFEIPEGVTTISFQAFYQASLFNPRFPSTLTSIEDQAFYKSGTDRLIINENATVGFKAFESCPNLVYAEWPTSFSYANSGYTSPVVSYCTKLADVYLKAPTKVTYSYQNFFDGITLSNITLHVPSFLVSTYKLDPYWSQCNVVGFDESDITDWYVKQPLKLNGDRIGGTPSLHISNNGNIQISGDATQTINGLSITFNPAQFQYYNGNGYTTIARQWGMMLSTTNKVNITGELSENLCTQEKTWYFVTLPFDMKVGDITTSPSSSYAIRYYDGANRASVGTGSNWKNYTKDDIIPAGTGFIYQTSKRTTSKFVAQNNATKQYILSTNEFVKSLQANPSDVTSNKGWNLVGNPWQTYYNIHKLNFTAPITVWNSTYSRYDAYSIIDDDYAIEPLQAFFVQCPDEVSQITFPIDGRQLTSTIESQSGAPAFDGAASERRLVDIELTNDELGDKTRFVLNPKAKMDYETTCDASKFMSLDASVPQLYTLQNGTRMAINERPAGDGIVQLGMMLPVSGTYTIKSERNELMPAVLIDKQTGTETCLTPAGYSFSAEAGTLDNRFELHLADEIVTGIQTIENGQLKMDNEPAYNLNGQRVTAPQKGIYVVNGKKVVIK